MIDKIICVGKNYLEHAQELGEAVPEKPVLFLKPASVLKQARQWGGKLQADFPKDDESVQAECELVFRIEKDAYRLEHRHQTQGLITRFSLGLDMTLRARQNKLKQQRHPWTCAKVFPDAAILAPWLQLQDYPAYAKQAFELYIDGQLQQQGYAEDMMMGLEDLLIYISHFFPLKAGDILFTGTPKGVCDITSASILDLKFEDKHVQIVFQ